MARVILTPSLSAEFTGAAAEMNLAASNLFHLVRELEAQFPGMGAFCEARVSMAVDGVFTHDWATALTPASEVLLVPRIAGGQ